jgi:VanZ family protein
MKYATILVSLLIIVAVLIPGGNLPEVSIGGYDKLIHAVMFALWACAVRYDFETLRYRYLAVLLIGLLFSILTEVLQLLVEGRSLDIFDMLADMIGLAVGLLVSGRVLRWIKDKVVRGTK